MKNSSTQIVICLLVISSVFFSACAKIVAPTGGPKDEEHPLIVDIEPLDYSINFESERISITFNEFIQLEDLKSNLIISPPIKESPEIKIKGKTLIVDFVEELKDSTTYNIYFGNSVQDFNEGNPIENFQYVLSTGSFIDSLSIEGQIINSFNLLPEADVFVLLYTNLEDSIPLKEIPVYISKTNEEGFFRINNIGNNEYKLFCLRDFNKNYLFDLPEENIAFIDSLVVFDLITEVKIDTIFKSDSNLIEIVEHRQDSIFITKDFNTDTLIKKTAYVDSMNVELDSLMFNPEKEIDSIIIEKNSYFPVRNYVLRLFTEERDVQYLSNNTRESRGKVELVFNKAIKDSLIFALADTVTEKEWYIKETGTNNDSIIYWITDSTIFKKENLVFTTTYQKEDSNLVYHWSTDTLSLRFFEQKKEKKKNKNQAVDTSLKYNLNIKNRGTMDLNRSLDFYFETPILSYDTSKIKLFAIVDTLEFPVEYDIERDSIKLRKYHMSVDWCEDTVYRLEIYPRAFKDIYQLVNDTSIIEFETQKKDFYGKILAEITGIDSSFQLICQLIVPAKDKEVIYREKIISKDQIIEFDYLPPKEFMFKVIIDKNFNKKWDTGIYLEHIQPEEVLYHEEKIKVRSNWDIEFNFNVNK